MKLVAGLGNPGERYRQTRHNLGFRVVDALRERLHGGAERDVCGASVSKAGDVLLVRPQIYMNRSGWSVRCVAALHAVDPADTLVVFDDVALPLGKLRLRPEGSPGGHRGMESVIESLRTESVPRLRLGIAPAEPPAGDLADFVLGEFASEEQPAVETLIGRGADAVLCWIGEGCERAMAKFNG